MFFTDLKFLFCDYWLRKPLRVALLKYLSLKFKQFRHYETILFESCLEAKKLGYKEVLF